MKNILKVSVFLLTISIIFISCSNQNQNQVDEDDLGTLRYKTELLLKTFEWTEELEPKRLTEYKSVNGISSNMRITNLSLLSHSQNENAIYPIIQGFAPLDISLLPENLLSSAKDFCVLIAKNEDADSFMAKNCLYSLALFYSKKNDAEYKNFLIGSPSINGTTYEIPVRFFGKKNNFDLDLFWIFEDNAWKVDQIRIRSTNGGKNGE